MGQQKMPADIRRAVTEWAEKGFDVTIDLKDGKISVRGQGQLPKANVHPCDLLDLS